jgi:hypothetical protein
MKLVIGLHRLELTAFVFRFVASALHVRYRWQHNVHAIDPCCLPQAALSHRER